MRPPAGYFLIGLWVALTMSVLINTTNLVLFGNAQLQQQLHDSDNDGSAHKQRKPRQPWHQQSACPAARSYRCRWGHRPLQRLPVKMAPAMPPEPCKPNASRVSSTKLILLTISTVAKHQGAPKAPMGNAPAGWCHEAGCRCDAHQAC